MNTTTKRNNAPLTAEQISARLKKMDERRKWSGYSYDELRREIVVTSAKLELESASIANTFKADFIDPFKRSKLTFKKVLNTLLIVNTVWNGIKIFRTAKKMFRSSDSD